MARVMKIFTVVRNNWKKTVVGIAALSYGANYARNKYRDFEMMHDYCEEALTHGEETIPVSMKVRNVTVILNPVANKRKAKKEFEKYCAPLLHLSGVSVTVIQTEMEGHARDLLENLSQDTDAIVVAGGDGTLSEVVTGLLRRPDADSFSRRVPVGIIPLGRTNSVANTLFSNHHSQPKKLAEATMSVVKGCSQTMDVIKIEPLEVGEVPDAHRKPIYSVSGLEWGPFRDAKSRQDKYWYFGPLRGYASYLFTGLKGENSEVSWSCKGLLEVSLPCAGCSDCIKYRSDLQPDATPIKAGRWWSAFMPKSPSGKKSIDYSRITSKNCSTRHNIDLNTSELLITTTNVIPKEDSIIPKEDSDSVPHLSIFTGPPELSIVSYMQEGWRRLNGNTPAREQTHQVKEICLWPKDVKDAQQAGSKERQKWISLDSEDYEIKALHMVLYPNRVRVFSPRKPVVHQEQ